MLIVFFFDAEGAIHRKFVPGGQKVNADREISKTTAIFHLPALLKNTEFPASLKI
jgi:hypothetical protein